MPPTALTRCHVTLPRSLFVTLWPEACDHMNVLSVENLSKRYGPRMLFEGFSFGMSRGEKVAIVAPNGSGKSTLLKAIAGVEPADSGEVIFRTGTRVGYLPQEPHLQAGLTLAEAIMESENPLQRAVLAYEKALKNPDDGEALQRAMDMMDREGAWDYDARVKEVLGRLGIDDTDISVDSASGGQRKRAALARV